mmetsp:Transcript_12040/g.30992  ORF Transcript_12040/g.30992 Transcript_12040/m.30992 type:complete len:347 (-) Transcript_12040:839-1879(-)
MPRIGEARELAFHRRAASADGPRPGCREVEAALGGADVLDGANALVSTPAAQPHVLSDRGGVVDDSLGRHGDGVPRWVTDEGERVVVHRGPTVRVAGRELRQRMVADRKAAVHIGKAPRERVVGVRAEVVLVVRREGRRRRRIGVGPLGAVGQRGDGADGVGEHRQLQQAVVDLHDAFGLEHGVDGRAPQVRRDGPASRAPQIKLELLRPEVGVRHIALATASPEQRLHNHGEGPGRVPCRLWRDERDVRTTFGEEPRAALRSDGQKIPARRRKLAPVGVHPQNWGDVVVPRPRFDGGEKGVAVEDVTLPPEPSRHPGVRRPQHSPRHGRRGIDLDPMLVQLSAPA